MRRIFLKIWERFPGTFLLQYSMTKLVSWWIFEILYFLIQSEIIEEQLPLSQLHRCLDLIVSCITCASAWCAVLPPFLMENKFHTRLQRKVATRHTLPNIQISLSFRKFSILERFHFLSFLSAWGCWNVSIISVCMLGSQAARPHLARQLFLVK